MRSQGASRMTAMVKIVTEGDQYYLSVLDEGRAGKCYDGDEWKDEPGWFHRFPVSSVGVKLILSACAEIVATEAQGE